MLNKRLVILTPHYGMRAKNVFANCEYTFSCLVVLSCIVRQRNIINRYLYNV